MKLAFDIDALTWLNPDNLRAALASASIRRNDVLPVDIMPVRDGKRVELSTDLVATVQLNKEGEYGGSGLASDSAPDKIGQGSETVYRFILDISGPDVDALFPSNEASAPGILEFQFSDEGFTQSSQPLPTTIQNAVIQS